MDVKKQRHGVVKKLGMVRCTCDNDSSMYRRSLGVMVGCRQGFSNDSHTQKMYQMIPNAPVDKTKEIEIKPMETNLIGCSYRKKQKSKRADRAPRPMTKY